MSTASAWPRLDTPGGRATTTSLQLWSQIVGKTRLARAPMANHWWQVPLYVSARGFTTSPIPDGDRVFEVELDLIAHRLDVRTGDGAVASMPLEELPLAEFYARYHRTLAQVGVQVALWPVAVELPERIRLDEDRRLCRYDPAFAGALHRAYVQAGGVFERFRCGFTGKVSPVHLFWGGFDSAVTRFSGRTAPPHPGGIPNVGAWVMREAYSHEVSSAGFWPGDDRFPEPAFYSYAYPEPPGFRDAPVRPTDARYDPALGEFLLPYAAVRAAADPAAAALAFLESTYVAEADLAGWDRAALERHSPDHTLSAGGDPARKGDRV